MALTIGQIAAVAYPAIVAENRKPASQWTDTSFLNEWENKGGVVRKSLGPTIEAPLDYQRNPDATFLATDLQATSLTKTEVMTSASYTPAQISVPVTWSKMDEAQTPTENQKIAFVSNLVTNGLNSHDDLIEQYIFQTSTNGFLGFGTHITTAGTGSVGGIDSGTFTFWQNKQNTYVDDTDIEATFTLTWDQCAKGSGSQLLPTLMVSGSTTNALFESSQQSLQRYGDQDFKAGAKSIMFKTAKYIFSQYASTTVYFLNPKNIQLVVSKEYFRDRGDTQEIQNANGFTFKIYSALQFIVTNRSRIGSAHL